MPVVSTAMCLVILRFYKNDVQKAKQIDQEVMEETKPLINEKHQIYDWTSLKWLELIQL